MENLLLVGGSGFIGTNLVHQITSKEYQLFNIDRYRNHDLGSNTQLITDIRDLEGTEQFFENNFKKIVYLAADIETSTSSQRIKPHINDTLLALANFLELIENNKKIRQSINCIILISSRAIYGEGSWLTKDNQMIQPGIRYQEKLSKGDFNVYHKGEIGIKNLPNKAETVLPNPVSFYGTAKLAQENMLKFWSQRTGVPYLIARLQNVIGTSSQKKNPYSSVIDNFCLKFNLEETIELYEDGKITRDFIDVLDVTNAIIKMIDESEKFNEVYDIGRGSGVTLDQICSIFEAFGHRKFKCEGKWNLGDVRSAFADIEKIKNDYHWSPKIPLETTLEKIIQASGRKR